MNGKPAESQTSQQSTTGSSIDNQINRGKTLEGAIYAILAYGFWGIVPIYWKLIGGVPSLQLVAQRVIWSVVALVPLLLFSGQLPAFCETLRAPKRLAVLFLTSVLLSANWLAFIWAVQHNAVLQSSLGYFMNPLANVLFGRIFLKEHLKPAQLAAFILAVAGVIALTVQAGTVPWISLFLAVTFSAYGLLRKVAPVEPLVGLSIETVLMFPFAFVYLAWEQDAHTLVFFKDWHQDCLVALAGPVTTLPLLWFAAAGKRLKYSTLGFFQYLSPTMQFLLAVLIYKESFTVGHLYAFGCIWTALGIYLADSLISLKKNSTAEEI